MAALLKVVAQNVIDSNLGPLPPPQEAKPATKAILLQMLDRAM
jgi:hypothetical protein